MLLYPASYQPVFQISKDYVCLYKICPNANQFHNKKSGVSSTGIACFFFFRGERRVRKKKEVKTSVCNFISSGFCVFIQQEKHMLSAKIILHSFAVL